MYRDYFPETVKRITGFCSEIAMVSTKSDLNDPSSNLTIVMVPCKGHNCYDEDCQDYKTTIEKDEQNLTHSSSQLKSTTQSTTGCRRQPAK